MKTLYEGSHVRLKKEGKWEFAERVGSNTAVSIIAHIGDKLITVRQLRIPTGEQVLEFPAGMMNPGETPEETASRELKEETGYRVIGHIKTIGPTYSSPGLTNEQVYIVEVKVSGKQEAQNLDPEENIEVIVDYPENLTNYGKLGAKLGTYLM